MKPILIKYDCHVIFLIILFGIKEIKNYGRRHLKLFTYCHVSGDTLYIS